MNTLQTLEMALEAFEWNYNTDLDNIPAYEKWAKMLKENITAIRETLSQPEQEPVAWATQMGEYAHIHWGAKRPEYPMVYEVPLYTSPPAQRTWVGLTDEEMRELEKQFNAERVRTSDEEYLVIYPGDYWQWQRAIEAKLKEKNT